MRYLLVDVNQFCFPPNLLGGVLSVGVCGKDRQTDRWQRIRLFTKQVSSSMELAEMSDEQVAFFPGPFPTSLSVLP